MSGRSIFVALKQKWAELSQREKNYLKFLGVFLFSVGLTIFYIKPFVWGAFQKKKQLNKLATEINIAIERMKVLEADVRPMTRKLKAAIVSKNRFKNALPKLLAHIGKQQTLLGFDVVSMSVPNPPSEPQQKASKRGVSRQHQAGQAQTRPKTTKRSPYRKIQVDVQIKATYSQLGKFLSSLDGLPMLVTVTKFVITKEREYQPNRVHISFDLVSWGQS